jgi:uncharacterized protein DUF4157
MSFERESRGAHGSAGAAAQLAAATAGKATLVQRAEHEAATSDGAASTGPGVQAAAAHGTSGAGGVLPHLGQIQRLFGRHDVSGVQAHTDGRAAEGARAMGADAFATGNQVAFAGAPDLHTAAHEAAHVIQQRAGVQLKGGVGEAGDAYEQHADAVADLVVQGKSAEGLLDRHAGGAVASTAAVQRHAFVNGTQVKKADPDAVGAVAALVTDDVIRDYTSKDELKKHAASSTDYLGTIADGTWLRFSPTGINLLGENHTQVSLDKVVPFINSKSFIYEPFSDDKLPAGSAMKATYEAENADRFKTFGVDKEPDKQQFGAESLFPKMGYGLNLAIPFFDGREPISGLKKAGYVGQPIQRYLKIAWGHSKDCEASVAKKLAAKQAVKPKVAELVKVYTAVKGVLDPFVAPLPVDGFLGDELEKPGKDKLLPPLLKFCLAFTEAMVEAATADPSSRLKPAEKAKLDGSATTSEGDKDKLFSDWRNFKFEDSVTDAAKRGVRYAGMGQAHLDHLKAVGLPPGGHPFEMDGDDIKKFRDHTKALRAKAVKQ